MSFLHGAKTNEVQNKTFSVVTVNSAIICLTGIAPYGALNTLVKVTGTTAAAQFGKQVPGYNIPQALDKIFAEGNATVMVVNVFNNTGTQTKVTAESITLVSSTATLAHIPTLSASYAPAVPVVTNSAGSTTYTLGTDYTISPFGVVTRIVSGGIGATDTLKVTYYYLVGNMTTNVSAEVVTVASRSAKTAFAPVIASQAPIVTDSTGATFYVAGTDYTIDDYGNIQILAAAITDGTTLKITYQKINTASGALSSASIAATIVGGIDGTSGAKSGMYCFQDTLTLFGFKPKILICPFYCTLSAVAAQMASDGAKYRAHYIIDAPLGTTIAGAQAGRAPSGTINFYTSDKRAILTYPEITSNDPSTGVNIPKPYSSSLAGVISNNDSVNGYWNSPSNKQIQGAVGLEVTIDGSLNDPSASNQQLNSVGIVTIFNAYGTGIRTWGNRNASFPTNTGIDSFICVKRTADIIEDSIEAASLNFTDLSVNQAFIDIVRAGINEYFRTLVSLGAIVSGSCTFDPAKNPPNQLAAGNIVFDYNFVPPPPAELIQYNSFIDISLLGNLK